VRSRVRQGESRLSSRNGGSLRHGAIEGAIGTLGAEGRAG
jgi:hypothetical protein